MGVNEQTEEAKAFWKEATARRRANGIRLGKLSVMVEKEQVESFLELYQTWITRWGKSKATDALIAAMADFEARYQDLRQLVLERKRKKKAKP